MFFLALYPKTTQAQWVVWDPGNNATNIAGFASLIPNTAANVSNTVKEYGLDAIAYIIAKAILRKITAQTVNWINSGFEGSPAFVTDPQRFFLNIGDQEASKLFIGANSPLNQLCSSFQPQVRLALVKNYLSDEENQYTCTFSKIGTNFENFTRDFSQGGWQGWFSLTQENQNNPYGAYQQAKATLSASIQTNQQKYQSQLNWGNGFLSFEKCPKGKSVGELYPEGLVNTAAVPTNAGNEDEDLTYEDVDTNVDPKTCTRSKEIVTPGSIINNQLINTLGTGMRQLEAADEINQIVNALFNQMLDKMISSVGRGLRSLSQKDSSSSKSITELLQESVNIPIATTTPSATEELQNAAATVPTPFKPDEGGNLPLIGPDPETIQAQVDRETELFRQRFQTPDPVVEP